MNLFVQAQRAGLSPTQAAALTVEELNAAIAKHQARKARARKRRKTEEAIRSLENDLYCSTTPVVERFAKWLGVTSDDPAELARKAYFR